MVQAGGARRGLKVWGSGFIMPPKGKRKYDFPDFDVYAVRGRLTLERMRADREVVLGDPGLLADRVYPRAKVVPGRVGFVYHHEHRKSQLLRDLAHRGLVTLIDPLRDPRDVVLDITKCEFVFSTSLHGLIVADSFAVPNAWVALEKPLVGDRYKFEDYYSAFDGEAVRHDIEVVEDRDAVAHLKREYRGVPDLENLQDRLLAAFPYEKRGPQRSSSRDRETLNAGAGARGGLVTRSRS
ncbi:polysaccharide pyruvyl transferase family protein [Gordonia amicalis]|uniref:polysaccharide pyruvyl transferase family protein n=1 Tax=Gordonia amicalis TaxID=89053 RepID=UPI0022A7614F|nr:polysaccharide pyruvyl transferase family protein [Gordonia amicalis]MCZ0914462.1 polysaccharide pyruvyl transferase family protein [Gordonia amicalis]